jgi:hypothetical protein
VRLESDDVPSFGLETEGALNFLVPEDPPCNLWGMQATR